MGFNGIRMPPGEAKGENFKYKSEYSSWCAMRNRCDNPSHNRYYLYGAKGITYDKRWSVFENFLEDMGPKPKGYSIERIDNSKGYYKENCKWADRFEQSNNRSSNNKVEYKGKTYTLKQFCNEFDLEYKTAWARFNELKWKPEDMIKHKPIKGNNQLLRNNKPKGE